MTETTGMLNRTKVSKSKPLRPNAPSPLTIRIFLLGWTTLAAMQKPVPTPSVPSGPGPMNCPGWFTGSTCDAEADDVAAVTDDDRLVVDELRDLVAEAEWVDGVSVGMQPLLPQFYDLCFAVAEFADPLVVLDRLATEFRGELQKRVLRVAFDADIDATVAAEFIGVDVDRDHLCVRG